MPTYKVVGTDLKHNKQIYPEGSHVELTLSEASALGGFVAPTAGIPTGEVFGGADPSDITTEPLPPAATPEVTEPDDSILTEQAVSTTDPARSTPETPKSEKKK